MIGGALVGNLSAAAAGMLLRFGCTRVGSGTVHPELILILILNFVPQLRVWLDFLAGNQSAAAAAAVAVAAIQVEAI